MEATNFGKIKYEVFGPFPFRSATEKVFRNALGQFWTEREEDERTSGLADAVGVYVWTIEQGKRRVPCNVGVADRQGFRRRFIQKEMEFRRLLKKQPDVEMDVYLLALHTKTGRLRKAADSQIEVNHWLEAMLIGAAVNVNPDLRNTAATGYLRRAVVDGYVNDNKEERSEAARSFNALFKA